MRNHILVSFDSDRPLTQEELVMIEGGIFIEVEEPATPGGRPATYKTDNIKITSYTT